ncbi:signal recognition particle-docking protein FtsY [Helcobacillus massiliensis]|uniref:signal recognition particle-docking protein FtsY n=1 Tax=Helcobacillus massiliensis TaxID=521392 RepID=UPI0021A57A7A|nr:signal recognition particle-docking protein FtsY [Helcobacillus massiliensis]MCT1557918.1 signal recognition particle-docking protein FtsY [Helcobacillus massiliensis]MCT2036542.1 signal recognition particle-docking protein FtsY [Helcobacillus massiliensis]MCT2332557.1 signal recognition particle-docking protein FtsY [Helcobacillus massiliensis]
MDPNDILMAVLAGGGGLAVIGGGIWAGMRSRTKPTTKTDGRRPEGRGAETVRPPARPRPAAPTWGDTLTAPAAPKKSEEAADAGPETAETPEAREAEAPSAGGSTAAATAPEAETESAAAPAEAADETVVDEAPVELEQPEPTADRMVRLRARLQRSGAMGRGLLNLLTRDEIDDATWEEIEETLLLADLGPAATDELMDGLRARVQVLGSRDPAEVHDILRDELVKVVDPTLDRRIAASAIEAPSGERVPSVIVMVGVNGTGKTTTTGKFGRVLIAEGRTVVFGAADTFRAAAAEQLTTWGERVGVDTVRSDREGADPASVAFDAVTEGIKQDVDVVVIDTAGRLQNKKGLMDELGKISRVASKALKGAKIQEIILVIDATTGQNGMQQARVFAEAVDITGIALTKLDGTAKGGIVVNVQRELGVPVKLVGLGEGMDDLTPFDPYGFVDALLEA